MFFCLQKVCYTKSCIKATDALNWNLNGRLLVTNCLKKARKLFKKRKKLREIRKETRRTQIKIAPNLKSCSKVAEQIMYSPSRRCTWIRTCLIANPFLRTIHVLSKAVLFAPDPGSLRARSPFCVCVFRAQPSGPLSRQSRLRWIVRGGLV